MIRKLLIIIVTLAVLLSIMVLPAKAALPIEIEQSIIKGLNWLVSVQDSSGAWSPGYDPVAHTGLALTKLEDRAYELGYESPFDPLYPYHTNVEKGLEYLFTQASIHPSVAGICFAAGGHETYNTGIAMMAIAASRTPDRTVPSGSFVGQTYKEVLQGNVNFFAASQNPDGGWRYVAFPPQESDQSNTGYAVLGLRFAEAPVYGFSCTLPATIKTGQNTWIGMIQDPVNGDPNDGGSWYTPTVPWIINILKTGNLLFEMAFAGDPVEATRVQDAVDFIERHWNDPNPNPGWRIDYQTMYCLMKGFEIFNIGIITVAGNPVNWFAQVSDVIVANQNGDGSWPTDLWGDRILTTCWALLTLERSVPSVVLGGRMTGGGSVMMEDERVTHGFTLHGDVAELPNNLEVNWGKGNNFHLEKLNVAHLMDNPNEEPNPPPAGFDVFRGAGTGRYNGEYGARVVFTFTDFGEPGKKDIAVINIWDAEGNHVLSVAGNLDKGNHQAHRK